MKKYLAIFSDEFNSIELNGFQLMTQNDMNYYEDLCADIIWDFTYTIGDEKLELTGGDDLLSRIDFKEITNEEYKALSKTFKNGIFGIFVSTEFLESIVNDEEERNDIEDDELDIDEDNEY